VIDDEDTAQDFEYIPSFDGPCTCEHETEEHSWGNCGVIMPGDIECPCEAGWTE
jgi:hypothetical protein